MVNINSFGNESLSHITINDYKRFLSGLFPGFIKFIEKVRYKFIHEFYPNERIG